MPVLYTLLGIVLFFCILFAIPLGAEIEYTDKTVVRARWLFLKFTVLDTSKPKQEKKPKKKKEKKKKDDEPSEEEEKPEETTQKGTGLIKQLYLDQGFDGLERMLRAVGRSLSGFFGKLYRTLTIDELLLTMTVTGGDAADTAIKYGKLCAWLYPVLGKLISTCKVKKYDVDVSPDYLAQKSKAEAFVKLHVIPIQITNALVVLAVQLLFRVLFKVLFSKKKSDASKKPPKAAAKPRKAAPSVDGEGQIEEKILDKDGVS